MMILKRSAMALVMGTALSTGVSAQEAPAETSARNVILMISDGAGMETWRAASFYRFGALGHQAYDEFDVKVFASTHPLNTSRTPTKSDEGRVDFDPAQLWATGEVETVFEGRLGDYKGFFEGYDYSRDQYTDSAAAGTALASGRKTYNSAINWSNDDEPMKHIGEYVVESGRALGVVSSVQWTHATPAAFLAHNRDRNAYAEMGRQIVEDGLATVVMGAGHPGFDDNGVEREIEDEGYYDFVGGSDIWERLVNGETDYRLIESAEDFTTLAAGELDMQGKDKVLGTAQAAATLQFNREGVALGDKIETVPELALMTTGALQVLSENESGFFLMVEGGAVDWAAHANNLPRLIEEQMDFDTAVEAAVDWVEQNSSWDETMIIVTTDHGNGLLQGPNSHREAYEGILNQGAGAMPLVRWHSDTHTRELVPLWAHGRGSDFFTRVAQADPGLAAYEVPEEARVYIDNTDVFRAAAEALGIEVEAPAIN